MVLLPFFLRSNDPTFRALYDKEMAIWGPQLRAQMERLPSQLVATSKTLAGRYNGCRTMVRAKYVGDRFVEKLCVVCGKGSHGERLSRCGRCGKAYYCGKSCQLADWGRHRRVDGCNAV
jgi:hypothetical protein